MSESHVRRVKVDSGNITQISGVPLTGRDWSADFQYIGGHRFKHCRYESGLVEVGPKTTLDVLSVSGTGFAVLMAEHDSYNVPMFNAEAYVLCDGCSSDLIRIPDVHWAWELGFTSVGNYQMGAKFVYVERWDETNDWYSIYQFCNALPVHFLNSLHGQLKNTNSSLYASMWQTIEYSLFVSSKRLVVKLPQFVSAKVLRRFSGVKRLYPIEVKRIGYFEDETEHPYREFLKDLPNKWDREVKLSDGRKVRSATPKAQSFVLEIYGPENWKAEKIMNKIKYDKILYEEVL
ncbi:MAG: hypothetical protein ACXQS5_06800 [Candidatus Methanospirareceae archaeon]